MNSLCWNFGAVRGWKIITIIAWAGTVISPRIGRFLQSLDLILTLMSFNLVLVSFKYVMMDLSQISSAKMQSYNIRCLLRRSHSHYVVKWINSQFEKLNKNLFLSIIRYYIASVINWRSLTFNLQLIFKNKQYHTMRNVIFNQGHLFVAVVTKTRKFAFFCDISRNWCSSGTNRDTLHVLCLHICLYI